MRHTFLPLFLVLLSLLLCAPAFAQAGGTFVVATRDSSEQAKARADYIGDGEGDQEQINAAIQALPAIGGTVLLMEGTYDIRRVEGALGGVIIDRDNVTLAGQGPSTRLIQAPEQETNVVRIIGSGVGHIVVRDLYIDVNRAGNPLGEGDPDISHDRFEFCGIKAYYQAPGGPGGEPNHDISVRNCTVLNARRLNIMLEGHNLKVIDNHLGNAGSDSVELLTGPGQIRGNYLEITGQTHVAIGSDRGNNILMSDNIIHVKSGGQLDIGLRSWADSQRHVMANNVIIVDEGGQCGRAMDVRGFGAVVTGNNVYNANEERLPLYITGGRTLFSGNLLENVMVIVEDATEAQLPVLIRDNLLSNSEIEVRSGNVDNE